MTIQTAFRLNKDILELLKRTAKDDGRSMTWHVNKALEAHLKKPEKKKSPVKKFCKPSRDDVIKYCFDRGRIIDGDRFYDYCETNGWKLSNGNAMKDWRAAIRTWEGRKREQKQSKESLIQRAERKASEKVASIENAEHSVGQDDNALWLQVDQHKR